MFGKGGTEEAYKKIEEERDAEFNAVVDQNANGARERETALRQKLAEEDATHNRVMANLSKEYDDKVKGMEDDKAAQEKATQGEIDATRAEMQKLAGQAHAKAQQRKDDKLDIKEFDPKALEEKLKKNLGGGNWERMERQIGPSARSTRMPCSAWGPLPPWSGSPRRPSRRPKTPPRGSPFPCRRSRGREESP